MKNKSNNLIKNQLIPKYKLDFNKFWIDELKTQLLSKIIISFH